VTRTLDRAFGWVQIVLVQGRVFMRATILDRKQGTEAVEDDNRLTLVLDYAPLTRFQF
jgi:hypothetical protein